MVIVFSTSFFSGAIAVQKGITKSWIMGWRSSTKTSVHPYIIQSERNVKTIPTSCLGHPRPGFLYTKNYCLNYISLFLVHSFIYITYFWSWWNSFLFSVFWMKFPFVSHTCVQCARWIVKLFSCHLVDRNWHIVLYDSTSAMILRLSGRGGGTKTPVSFWSQIA